MREAYVVGHIDNTNGMATWCWEAAHALHDSGLPVILTAAEGVPLPGDPDMPVIVIPRSLESPFKTFKSRLSTLIDRLTSLFIARPNPYLDMVTKALVEENVTPLAFILNNGVFVDQRLGTPQFVAGWSYPVTFFGYLAKRKVLSRGESMKARAAVLLDLAIAYRSDWRAYRNATGTLAVSRQLQSALEGQNIRAYCVYPCTRLPAGVVAKSEGIPKLLMAADSLDDPRKGIRWMLESMGQHSDLPSYELFLVGRPNDDLRLLIEALPNRVNLCGRLRRDELQMLMVKCDIFCFASAMDDWGYVLSEALANGMVPIAPALSPFDEILGSSGYSYTPRDSGAFASSLDSVLRLTSEELNQAKFQAYSQAKEHFSAPAFSRNLLASMGFAANIKDRKCDLL
jgi:hypothetical protein